MTAQIKMRENVIFMKLESLLPQIMCFYSISACHMSFPKSTKRTCKITTDNIYQIDVTTVSSICPSKVTKKAKMTME